MIKEKIALIVEFMKEWDTRRNTQLFWYLDDLYKEYVTYCFSRSSLPVAIFTFRETIWQFGYTVESMKIEKYRGTIMNSDSEPLDNN